MNNRDLNATLRESAIACGLCDQWQKEWRKDWDVEKMISRFYKGMDFFLKYRFISNSFMKDNFDITLRRIHGILIDDEYSLLNIKNAIILGNSKSKIRLNSNNASLIYVLDNSEMSITAKGRSFAIVHVFGDAVVNAEAFDDAKVTLIIHSETCKFKEGPKVKVKYELDYLT